MSGLQQHYTERHALRGGAFDTPMTEHNSVQLPFRRHQQLKGSPLLGFVLRHPFQISMLTLPGPLVDLLTWGQFHPKAP